MNYLRDKPTPVVLDRGRDLFALSIFGFRHVHRGEDSDKSQVQAVVSKHASFF
jgi:hypothetical protein